MMIPLTSSFLKLPSNPKLAQSNAINSHAAYNTRGYSCARLAPRGAGFWQKYIFSTDHKVIGIQYGITGLLFLFSVCA
jgi:hypothetical protein